MSERVVVSMQGRTVMVGKAYVYGIVRRGRRGGEGALWQVENNRCQREYTEMGARDSRSTKYSRARTKVKMWSNIRKLLQ